MECSLGYHGPMFYIILRSITVDPMGSTMIHPMGSPILFHAFHGNAHGMTHGGSSHMSGGTSRGMYHGISYCMVPCSIIPWYVRTLFYDIWSISCTPWDSPRDMPWNPKGCPMVFHATSSHRIAYGIIHDTDGI